LPQSNANDYAAGKSDAYAYSYGYGYNYAGNSDADGYGDSNHHTTPISYADRDRDGYNYAETYADAKTTAHSISSSDAVSEWVKKLK
jgi:hypothetical protein